ncbi:MAG: hypothetical protein GC171_14135 [Terrimonas sp.]|nr:hypothetical protein [Terrimonas sp.]
MERIKVLIDKLRDQAAQEADPGQLMLTLQMIQHELQHLQAMRSRSMGTSKVSVTMPSFMPPKIKMSDTVKEVVLEEQPVIAPFTAGGQVRQAYNYDPLTEIPTLSHQKIGKDINEAIADAKESINDRLNEKKTELGERLMDTPIRDLRKAIGINDRFTFISELFRGDEAMYERSLKTINSFNIYPEAEYWISRELEIKLGWDSASETVIHFYQLVKRRFS